MVVACCIYAQLDKDTSGLQKRGWVWLLKDREICLVQNIKPTAEFHTLAVDTMLSSLADAEGLAGFTNSRVQKGSHSAQRTEKLQLLAQKHLRVQPGTHQRCQFSAEPWCLSSPSSSSLPSPPSSPGRLTLICLQLAETKVTGLAAGTEEICAVNSSLSCEMNKLGVEKEIQAKSTFPVLIKLFPFVVYF